MPSVSHFEVMGVSLALAVVVVVLLTVLCCGNQPLVGLSCWGTVGRVIIRWDSQQKYVLKYM